MPSPRPSPTGEGENLTLPYCVYLALHPRPYPVQEHLRRHHHQDQPHQAFQRVYPFLTQQTQEQRRLQQNDKRPAPGDEQGDNQMAHLIGILM